MKTMETIIFVKRHYRIRADQEEILEKIGNNVIGKNEHVRRALDTYISRPDIQELAAKQEQV